MKKKVSVIGSTGSIGTNSLDVIERHSGKFEVAALAALKNWKLLAEQALKFKPSYVAIADSNYLPELEAALVGTGIKIKAGEDAVIDTASHRDADIIISAISGSDGLKPTFQAIKSGKVVALANKESLAMAGRLIMNAAKEHGTTILPIDSEHSAIFQALQAGKRNEVKRIILTASGGPFFNYEADKLESVTPAEAMKHPIWKMGSKISVDSATMANKGIEVMEAVFLFDIPCSEIDVVIHPQSIIHSMVEYIDGSVIAQMGFPDMRIPIQYALTWPEREIGNNSGYIFNGKTEMLFLQPKNDLFPALPLAYRAIKMGDYGTIAYNAADEAAVDAFIRSEIQFNEISLVIEEVLNHAKPAAINSIEDVLDYSSRIKNSAEMIIRKIHSQGHHRIAD